MSFTKSKHFTKRQLDKESTIGSSLNDFERDDDDPLSIRSLSITSFGIIFAFMTFVLPLISIFIARPFSQGNEVITNHDLKKDGS